uniref:Uncharacterized protein n=1 Tax=viral metagenome TaxID=1070528 RepID=A0A6H1ZEX8_9ZZZZ
MPKDPFYTTDIFPKISKNALLGPYTGALSGRIEGREDMASQLAEALQGFDNEVDIQQYKKFKLHEFLETNIGTSPYIQIGDNRAVFNPKAEILESKDEDDPKMQAYKGLHNRLVKFQGGVPEPNFMRRALGTNMTAGWAELVAGFNPFDGLEGMRITDKGIAYKGNELDLSPEENKVFSDYVMRTSGLDEELPFWEKVGIKALGLVFDLPLMAIASRISAPIVGRNATLSAMMKSKEFLPRVLGSSIQQALTFNILGVPQTVNAINNKDYSGAIESVYTSALHGALAATTATLGSKIFETQLPFIKSMLASRPALKSELGGLAGSFGFGYLSSKLGGESSEDAIATGLSFAALHFSNPRAYERAIGEHRTRNVKVAVDNLQGGRVKVALPNYYEEADGKLFRIEADKFTSKGDISRLGVDPIILTPDNKNDYAYYNEVMSPVFMRYADALKKEREGRFADKIYKRWKAGKKFADDEHYEARVMAQIVASSMANENISKTFAKWKIPFDAELSNKMVKLVNDWNIPFSKVENYVVANLKEFFADPASLQFVDKGANPVMTELAKLTEEAGKSFVKKDQQKMAHAEMDSKQANAMKTDEAALAGKKDNIYMEMITPRYWYVGLGEENKIPAEKIGEGAYKIGTPENSIEIKVTAENENKLIKKQGEVETVNVGDKFKVKFDSKKMIGEITSVSEDGKQANVRTDVGIVTFRTSELLRSTKISEKPIEEGQISQSKPTETTQASIEKPSKTLIKQPNLDIAQEKKESQIVSKELVELDKKQEVAVVASDAKDAEIMVKATEQIRNWTLGGGKIAEIEGKNLIELESLVGRMFKSLKEELKLTDEQVLTAFMSARKIHGNTKNDIANSPALVGKFTDIAKLINKLRASKGTFKGRGMTESVVRQNTKIVKATERIKELLIEKGNKYRKVSEPISEFDRLQEQYSQKAIIDAMTTTSTSEAESTLRTTSSVKEVTEGKKLEGGGREVTELDEDLVGSTFAKLKELNNELSDIKRKNLKGEEPVPSTINQLIDYDQKQDKPLLNWNERKLLRTEWKEFLDDPSAMLRSKAGEDRGYKKLTPEEIVSEVGRLNEELKGGWKAEFHESLSDKGITDFVEKVIRLGSKSTADTPFHEVLHRAVGALGKEAVWRKLLMETGKWDGKGDIFDLANTREAHEQLANEYADYVLKGIGKPRGIFDNIKQFFTRVASWLQGNGYHDKASYFKRLAEGKLGIRAIDDIKKVDKLYQRVEEVTDKDINEPKMNETEQEFKYVYESTARSKFVKPENISVDKVFDSALFRNKLQYARGFVKRIWENFQTPTYIRYRMDKYNEVYTVLQNQLVREQAKRFVELLRTPTRKNPDGSTGIPKWDSGKMFKELTVEDKQGMLDALEKYSDHLYDGVIKRQMNWEEFYDAYKINSKQQEVLDSYRSVMEEALIEAKEGFGERLMKFNKGTSIIRLIDNKKMVDALFPKEEYVDYLKEYFKDKEEHKMSEVADADLGKLIDDNIRIKERITSRIAEEAYNYGPEVYFNSVRPTKLSTYIIKASRASINPNHAVAWNKLIEGESIWIGDKAHVITKKDAEKATYMTGKEAETVNITKEQYEKNPGLVEHVTTYGENSAEALGIVGRLEAEGYSIDKGGYFKVGDLVSSGEHTGRLTARQLMSLADAGYIQYSNDIMQKLFKAIKHGKFEQHGVHKSFEPGLKWTPKEFEVQLERFVKEALSSRYRHNALLEANETYTNWMQTGKVNDILSSKLGAKIKFADGTEVVVTENIKNQYRLEKDLITKYINQMTYSDDAQIDGLRGWAATTYTALKASFLTQQLFQGLQTTMHLASGTAKLAGLGGGYGNSEFLKSYGMIHKIITYKRAIEKGLSTEGIGHADLADFMKMYYFELEKMGKVNRVQGGFVEGGGIAELTFMRESPEVYYGNKVNKGFEAFKKYVNMASGGIEKATRVQAAWTFYKIMESMPEARLAELGLTTHKAKTNWLADKIDESMSQWGLAGRPSLLVPKILGERQNRVLKNIDKSFFTFKTFGTHNIGMYEYLARNQLWTSFATKVMVGTGLHGITKLPFLASAFAIANLFMEDDAEYETLKLLDELDSVIGKDLADIFKRGGGTLVGIDLRNLMDERSILPTDVLAESRAYSVEGKIAEAMLGAPYGVVKDVYESAEGTYKKFMTLLKHDGVTTDEEKKRINKQMERVLPLFFRNILNGMRLQEDGVELRGKTIIKSDELSWGDVFYKFVGFQPTKISEAYEEQFHGVIAKTRRIEGKITEMKKIRKEATSNKDRTKANQYIVQYQKELAKLKWSNEYKQAKKQQRGIK